MLPRTRLRREPEDAGQDNLISLTAWEGRIFLTRVLSRRSNDILGTMDGSTWLNTKTITESTSDHNRGKQTCLARSLTT
jgi:hypothetical protein